MLLSLLLQYLFQGLYLVLIITKVSLQQLIFVLEDLVFFLHLVYLHVELCLFALLVKNLLLQGCLSFFELGHSVSQNRLVLGHKACNFVIENLGLLLVLPLLGEVVLSQAVELIVFVCDFLCELSNLPVHECGALL